MMTPGELAFVRSRMENMAQEAVISQLATMLKEFMKVLAGPESTPQLAEMLARRLEARQANIESLTVSGIDPATSDLLAGECQEAFERVAARLIEQLRS